MGVFGDTLKQARAEKGVTLKEAEQTTHISRHHLAALEEENFAVLPAGLVYQRGSVRNYAQYLNLDTGKLLEMFEEAAGGGPPDGYVNIVKPPEIPNHWSPNFAIISFMVVMGAIVFTWVYSISFNNPAAIATLPPVIPTVTPIPEDRLALPAPTQAVVTPVVTSDQVLAAAPTVTPATQQQQALVISTPPQAGLAQLVSVSPTPIPTPSSVAAAPTPEPVQTQAQQVAADDATRPAPANAATIRITAQGDIDVTVTGDGVTLFSGWLGAGTSTDWFTAGSFQVSTSDGSMTLFENADTGAQFYMGYGANETYSLSNS